MAFTAKMNSKLPKEPIQTTEGDLKLLLKYKVCGGVGYRCVGVGGVQVWVGWGGLGCRCVGGVGCRCVGGVGCRCVGGVWCRCVGVWVGCRCGWGWGAGVGGVGCRCVGGGGVHE